LNGDLLTPFRTATADKKILHSGYRPTVQFRSRLEWIVLRVFNLLENCLYRQRLAKGDRSLVWPILVVLIRRTYNQVALLSTVIYRNSG